MPVRVYEIAKKLGIENKEVLVKAKELSIAAAKVPSSALDFISAEWLEEEIIKSNPAVAARLALKPVEEKPKPAPVEEKIQIIHAPEPEPKPEQVVEAIAKPAPLPSDAPVITMKSPIVVRALAEAMKLKPFSIIAELMKQKVKATFNQTIDEKIAAQVAAHFGYKLEVEKHTENGGNVHREVEKGQTDVAAKGTESNASTYVVDGLNVIKSFDATKRSLGVLLTMLVEIKKKGFNFYCVFDANTPHEIRREIGEDSQFIYDALRLFLPEQFIQVRDVEADSRILSIADADKLSIVSNDNYKKYKHKYPWLSQEDRRPIKGDVIHRRLRVDRLEIDCEVRTDLESMARDLNLKHHTAPSNALPCEPKVASSVPAFAPSTPRLGRRSRYL